MTDAELSRDLALALGYHPESVRLFGRSSDYVCEVYRRDNEGHWDTLGGFHIGGEHWYAFDYRQPDVALPLLKWLIVERWAMLWYSPCHICLMIPMDDHDGPIDVCANTLEEAVAKAVIAVGRG